jgi:hypothetical protein
MHLLGANVPKKPEEGGMKKFSFLLAGLLSAFQAGAALSAPNWSVYYNINYGNRKVPQQTADLYLEGDRAAAREVLNALLARPANAPLAQPLRWPLGAMDLAARGKTQPEVAQASRDDEADPAHPYRCSPATDNDWPTHVNPQEMEERHHRENYAGQHIKCSLIHGPILQGFHNNNSPEARRSTSAGSGPV